MSIEAEAARRRAAGLPERVPLGVNPETFAKVLAMVEPAPSLAPVFLPPPLPIDPECESSGCACEDEFDTYCAGE